MATIDNILTEVEAYEHALYQLGKFIKNEAVLPNRKLIIADEDYTTPTVEYITLQTLTDMNMHGMYSEKPRSYTMDVDGTETYIYDHIVYVQLHTYLGDAFKDMKVLKTKLRNKNLWETYFNSDGKVGIVSVGVVNNTPTITDDQSTEQGATMTVGLSYIFKHVETGSNYISEISYTTTVTKSDEGETISRDDTVTDE